VHLGHFRLVNLLPVHIQLAGTLGGQPIEAGRGCPAQDASAVDTQLSPAEVVHENQDNVGLFILGM